ncbi:hypothetical protein VAA96_004541 [Salmonella enterica]|nr:hypothetical protein [Salmonella enterica]
MAFWDSLNNDDDISLNFGGSDYDPTKSNALGDSLAPINPKGLMSAVDPVNDTRSASDFKFDAQSANQDATNTPDESDNYFITSSGNKYEKVNNSTGYQMLAAATDFLTSYWSNGDVGAAANAAGQAVYDLDTQAHRLNQAEELEKKGYNPMDIQAWVKSGDKKDLVTNKGKWGAAGNGIIYNDLTGATQNTMPGLPAKTVTAGDTVVDYMPDGTRRFTNTNPYMNGGGIQVQGAQQPGAAAGSPSNGGGSITSIDQQEAQPLTSQPIRDNKGNYSQIPNQYVVGTGEPVYTSVSGQPVTMSGNVIPQNQLTTQTLEQQQAQTEKQTNKANAIQDQLNSIDSSIAVLNNLTNSPGFSKIYGKFAGSGMGKLVGSMSDDYNNADALRQQLQGKTFLHARQYLKGQGAITDFESNKAEQSETILNNPRISADVAAKAATEYLNILNQGKLRLQNMQQQGGQKPQTQGSAPAGAIQALRQNPQLANDFKAKYGYLPEGF